MAATGIPTPNLGLRIPQGTDPASVDDINYNSNLLDTKLGAVGNTSVQDQIDSLNSNTVKKTDRVLIDRNPSATLSDCNEVTQAGMYRLISSTANRPSNISYGVLVHLMSNDYVVQFIIGTNGVFASRGKSAGGWGSWQ